MFMGHYGPAVWDTQRGKGDVLVPLWVGFLAVQFIDIIFAIFAIIGLEGDVRMVGGAPLFTIPYSHSLITALGWSLIGGLLFKGFRPTSGMRGFWVVFGLVFSHWVLDLIVHRPDLPLWPGSAIELGLGFWNYPILAFALEMGLLSAGLLYWMRVTTGPRSSVIGLSALFLFMGVLQVLFILVPGIEVKNGTFDATLGPQGVALGLSMLFTYGILCFSIAWIEKRRAPRVS
jgi:hypothetical protein